MTISNLLYEEIVLLQDILVKIDAFCDPDLLHPDDQDTFDSLYEKVMSS